jgi:Protein of unknown function (DUF1071)
MEQASNPFARLLAIDVTRHIEHKAGFAYLSWPYAVAQLRQADPGATWEVKRFNGLPYLHTDLGFFVEVAVTVQGLTLSQIHPVLDGRNRPIAAPTAFEINTSIQRCLVKAIALHGLGLSLYAGEDLAGITDAGEAQPFPTRPAPSPLRAVDTPTKPQPPRPPAGDVATPNQVRYLERLIDEAGIDVHQLLDYFGFDSLETVSRSEVDRVIRAIQSKRRAA